MRKNKRPDFRNLYGPVLDSIPDMLILCDRDTAILDIMHLTPALFPNPAEYYIGRRLTDDELKSVVGIEAGHLERLFASGESQRFIFRHKGSNDGGMHYYEVILSLLKRDLLLADIRTLHEDSSAQFESDHLHYFFTQVLDNITIPISVKSMETGRYVYWSKKAEIFGRTAAEMVGTTEDFFMSPENAREARMIDQSLATGERLQYDSIEKHILSDGLEHTFAVSRTPFVFCNEKMILTNALDISELKETQTSLLLAKNELAQKNMILSSVLSLAKVVPWGCDLASGTFFCDYNAYHPDNAPEPDKQGRYVISMDNYFSGIHRDYREEAIKMIRDLSEGKLEEFQQTYQIHWFNDREWEWVQVQSSIAKRGPDGRPVTLIGSAQRITEQKAIEIALREAKEEAERSNCLKSAFLANMSHEIRTPLNAIVGFSELLAQTDDSAEKQEYLGIIQNSNTLLLKLIGDILDLSKIEAGTLEFSFADHDLNAIMEELERSTLTKAVNPAVEVRLRDSLPACTIHTDRGRLLQVLHNFINNAIKFTHEGHIHFGYRREADGRWYFYVEDTGYGISAERSEHIFDRFVKLDAKVKGTGLGLAISKSIIERLGGEIGVDSAEGAGSTFWFRLPADAVTLQCPCDTPATEIPKPSEEDNGMLTLLIAEDDSANYRLFEVMLRKHYKLIHAWNGREAVELYKQHRPSMILMDIKMPQMDGYEATAAIREISPEVPIVAVTAFAYPDDMRRILSAGFNGCLPKPVRADNLKQKIAELCPAPDSEGEE